MATFFKNSIINDIGTTPVTVISNDPARRSTVIGLSLANLTESLVTVDVEVSTLTSSGYYIKGVHIPPNQSLKVVTNGEKLIIAENGTLTITCDTAAGVDAVVSYVDIV